MLWRFCLILFVGVLLEWKLTHSAPAEVGKTKEKVRAYEFGFSIEENQHRHEKRDENGIVMGEFGFITADGIYHVTVYATDENGKFKIVSMKSYPYGGSPEKKVMIATLPMVKKPVVVKALIPDGSSCGGCVLPKKSNNLQPANVGGKKPGDQKAVFKPLSKDLSDASSPGGGLSGKGTATTQQSKPSSTPLASGKGKLGPQQPLPKSPGSQPLVPPKLASGSGAPKGSGVVASNEYPDINVRIGDEGDQKTSRIGITKGNGKQAQGAGSKISTPISPSNYDRRTSIPFNSKSVAASAGSENSKLNNRLGTQSSLGPSRPAVTIVSNTKTPTSLNTKNGASPIFDVPKTNIRKEKPSSTSTPPRIPTQPSSSDIYRSQSSNSLTEPSSTLNANKLKDQKAAIAKTTNGNGIQVQGSVPKISTPSYKPVTSNVGIKNIESKNQLRIQSTPIPSQSVVTRAPNTRTSNPLSTKNVPGPTLSVSETNNKNERPATTLTSSRASTQLTAKTTNNHKSLNSSTDPRNTLNTIQSTEPSVGTPSYTKTSNTLASQNIPPELRKSDSRTSPTSPIPKIPLQSSDATDTKTKTTSTSPGLTAFNTKTQSTSPGLTVFNTKTQSTSPGPTAFNTKTQSTVPGVTAFNTKTQSTSPGLTAFNTKTQSTGPGVTAKTQSTSPGQTAFNTKTQSTGPGVTAKTQSTSPELTGFNTKTQSTTTINSNNALRKSGLPAYNTNTIPKEQQSGKGALPNTFTQNTATKSIPNTKEIKSKQSSNKRLPNEGSSVASSQSSSTPQTPTRNAIAPIATNTLKQQPANRQGPALVTPSSQKVSNNAFTQSQLNTNSPTPNKLLKTNTNEAKTQTSSTSPSKNLPSGAPSTNSAGKTSSSTNGGSASGSTAASAGGGGKGGSGGAGKGGTGGGGSGASGGGPLYRFNYVLDYNSHREEGRTDGSKEGKYNTIDEDGIRRIIDYIANENGYQPHIKLERLPPNEVPTGENKLKEYEFVWFQ